MKLHLSARVLSTAALAALGLLPASLSAQTVHVVDQNGGYDFTTIHEAVSAAASGDLVIVRSGHYLGGFVINGKSLTIAEETGHTVTVEDKCLVTNLAADQTAEIIGLDCTRSPDFSYYFGGLTIRDNEGAVQVVGGTFDGYPNHPGIIAEDSAQVTISQATMLADSAGTAGLQIIDANVDAYGCTMLGGQGFAGSFVKIEGGEGVSLRGGRLFAAGCDIRGGNGSNKGCGNQGTHGGIGLRLENNDPEAILRDCVVMGGVPGSSGGELCVDNYGASTVVETGTATTIAGPARSFDLPPLAREGDVASIVFSGEPGDLCTWIYSLASQPAWFPAAAGSVVPGGAIGVAFMGVIGSDGALTVPFDVPDFGPAFIKIYEQPLYVTNSGPVMGDPLVSLLVSDQF